jgi:hypothetical protein
MYEKSKVTITRILDAAQRSFAANHYNLSPSRKPEDFSPNVKFRLFN